MSLIEELLKALDYTKKKVKDNLTLAVEAPEVFAERSAENILRQLEDPTTFVMKGTVVKHASPFKFNEFSKGKLRSGEGSNVIAPGTYLSEHPDTNLFYQDLIKKLINPDTNPTLKAHRYAVESNKLTAKPTDVFDGVAIAKKNLAAAEEKHRSLKFEPTNYTVDLPDDQILKMLDWDKPLKQLSKQERSAIQFIAEQESLPVQYRNLNLAEERTGREFYEAMVQKIGDTEVTANLLSSYGIPGVRYLDRLSRDKGGTSNYVVFDPDILKILKSEPIK